MSVQVRSIQSRHSLLGPCGPTAFQPAGISRESGHKEYWPSSFTSTKKLKVSSSKGFVIVCVLLTWAKLIRDVIAIHHGFQAHLPHHEKTGGQECPCPW